MAALVGSFFLFAAAIAVYAIQLMTPWGWLKADQLKELHTLIFSGAIGALVARGVKHFSD